MDAALHHGHAWQGEGSKADAAQRPAGKEQEAGPTAAAAAGPKGALRGFEEATTLRLESKSNETTDTRRFR